MSLRQMMEIINTSKYPIAQPVIDDAINPLQAVGTYTTYDFEFCFFRYIVLFELYNNMCLLKVY